MRRKYLKLVIFDCDGTLVDSQHMIVAAMTKAYGAHGIPLPKREVLLSVIGLSLVEAFTKLGEERDQFPAESLANHYRDAFQPCAGPVRRLSHSIPGRLKPSPTSRNAATSCWASQRGNRNVVCGWCSGITGC